MKKILLLALGLLMCASVGFAQPGGNIGGYWDIGGTTCYAAAPAGLCKVYFFHTGIAKAGACQFLVQKGGGWTEANMQYVGFSTSPYLNILSSTADPYGGISIAYGNPLCEPLPAKVMEMTIFCIAPPACGYLTVVADPLASITGIEVRNCTNKAVQAAGGTTWVGDAGCGVCNTYVPNEHQTWGQIKSLYQ